MLTSYLNRDITNRNNSLDIHYNKYCIIEDTPKHYIIIEIEIEVFAIANTTRPPDQNTLKQETSHGALVVVLGDAAHS